MLGLALKKKHAMITLIGLTRSSAKRFKIKTPALL
jgi:hypothetical protein